MGKQQPRGGAEARRRGTQDRPPPAPTRREPPGPEHTRRPRNGERTCADVRLSFLLVVARAFFSG